MDGRPRSRRQSSPARSSSRPRAACRRPRWSPRSWATSTARWPCPPTRGCAVQKLTLSPTDGFLLSRIDGVLTAREIFQIIPLPQEDVERSLFALLCTGMVEYGTRTCAAAAGRRTARRRRRRPARESRPRRRPKPRAPRLRPPPPPPPRAAAAAPPPARPGASPPAPAADTRTEAQMAAARDSVDDGGEAPRRGQRPKDAIAELGARPRAAARRGEHPRAPRAGPRLHDDAQAARPRGGRPDRGHPRQPEGSRAARRSTAGCTCCAATATAAMASFRKALEIAPGHAEAQAELDAVATAQDAPMTGRTKRGSARRFRTRRRRGCRIIVGCENSYPWPCSRSFAACGGSDSAGARRTPESTARHPRRAGSHPDPEPIRGRLRHAPSVVRRLRTASAPRCSCSPRGTGRS